MEFHSKQNNKMLYHLTSNLACIAGQNKQKGRKAEVPEQQGTILRTGEAVSKDAHVGVIRDDGFEELHKKAVGVFPQAVEARMVAHDGVDFR